MNKNILIIAVLAILIIISAVQAFQLNDLKEKVSSGSIGKTSSPVVVQSGGATPAGNDINQLPSMVGGC